MEPLRLRLAEDPEQRRRLEAARAIELAVTPGHDLDEVFAHAQAALGTAAGAEAIRLGARRAAEQPAPDRYRVLLDPAGHPFCLSTQIPE